MPSSPFAVGLASLLHSADFIGAAEHIEKSLLDAGVELLNAKLPEPARAIAAPVETAVEDLAVEATDDAFKGQPINASSMESRIAAAVSQAVVDALGKALPGLAGK